MKRFKKEIVKVKIILLFCGLIFSTGCGNDGAITLQPVENVQDTQVKYSQDVDSQEKDAKEQAQNVIYVDVCGCVRRPGVYEMQSGSRVYEAIESAGGYTEEADTISINQAAVLSDGQKIVVPMLCDENDVQGNGQMNGAASTTANTQEDGLIDLNHASVQQLCDIPGIGETRATQIVNYRTEHGLFQTIEDVMQVSGIKQATFEKMKSYIKVLP